MRKTLVLLLFFSIKLFAQQPFGINVAGAEFGSNIPGNYNYDYTYPTTEELDYFHSKNLNLIRLPFRWERVQNTLGGSLNTVEINRIKNFLSEANSRGMVVLIDLHNYGRYTY